MHHKLLSIIHVYEWANGIITTNHLLKKNPFYINLISFIHSYFKGLRFFGVCDSFCILFFCIYNLVCWHVKCWIFCFRIFIFIKTDFKSFSFPENWLRFPHLHDCIFNLITNWWFSSNKKPLMKCCFFCSWM